MNKELENAVDVVKSHLETNQYSYSIKMCHLRCYKLLNAYLAETGKSYSEHLANQWLQSITIRLCITTVRTYKRALKKLHAAYHHKKIDATKNQYDARQNYHYLYPWCKNLLDAFMKEMTSTCARSYLPILRIAAARFLNYATTKGCDRPEEITHQIISDYYRDDKHINSKSKDAYNSSVRKFLYYLSKKGLIQGSIPFTLDKFVLPRLVFIKSLTDRERDTFMVKTNASSIKAEAYYAKVLEMTASINQHRYSKGQMKVFRMAFRELFVFLEANSLSYSIGTALAWVNNMRQFTIHWKSFRRAIMLFEQYRTNGQINPQKVYSYKPNRFDALPLWCREDYESFCNMKKKEEYAKTTLVMYRSSCLRLLEYLHKRGVGSWEAITPELLKAFHRQDIHSTPEGKNAYNSKIRIFLEYLGDAGKISPSLFMAVPSESAPRTSIVRTLNNGEIECLYRKQQNALNAKELRDMAIIMIGLRMGLRASDVTQMKFSDINWEETTVSVQQQKTGRFLKLPMPIEVGNALYRYIMEGRPSASVEYIFISHRVPYNRLHPAACRRALNNALQDQSAGFHVTRKTFASRMLANNVATGRIAEALGHACNESVMPYLSTNNDNMRLCALPLKGIPIKAGVLL